jgi:hypothetical protein
MLVVRCKDCNKELTSHPSKTQCCGCSNMMTVCADNISAIDLTKVIIINSNNKKPHKKTSLFSPEELEYQESRRKRKVRKLDFEIR